MRPDSASCRPMVVEAQGYREIEVRARASVGLLAGPRLATGNGREPEAGGKRGTWHLGRDSGCGSGGGGMFVVGLLAHLRRAGRCGRWSRGYRSKLVVPPATYCHPFGMKRGSGEWYENVRMWRLVGGCGWLGCGVGRTMKTRLKVAVTQRPKVAATCSAARVPRLEERDHVVAVYRA